MIKNITYKKKTLALIVKNKYLKKKGINFFTNNNLSQQVAYINHKKGHVIQPHLHNLSLHFPIFSINVHLTRPEANVRVMQVGFA